MSRIVSWTVFLSSYIIFLIGYFNLMNEKILPIVGSC